MSSVEDGVDAIRARTRAFLHEQTVGWQGAKWYAHVFNYVGDNARILDVGVGTGAALVANANIIRAKNLHVTGVEKDADYAAVCAQAVREAGLQALVHVVHKPLHQYTPHDNRLFDHVYFGGSFMLLPDPARALADVVELLVDREDGRVMFAQRVELKKNVWMEWIQPKLRYVTAVEWGNLVYEGDFEDALYQGGVVVESSHVLSDENAVQNVRETRFVVSRSRLYVPVATESAT